MRTKDIDDQIVALLLEHGLTVEEYFPPQCLIRITQLPLPPDSMDAGEFLRAVAFKEASLKAARESLAELAEVADQEATELAAARTEVDTIFTQLWEILHTRIIDSRAFRARLSELLEKRLDIFLAARKAQAEAIARDRPAQARGHPASEPAPP
jgi:hypothetical protein